MDDEEREVKQEIRGMTLEEMAACDALPHYIRQASAGRLSMPEGAGAWGSVWAPGGASGHLPAPAGC